YRPIEELAVWEPTPARTVNRTVAKRAPSNRKHVSELVPQANVPAIDKTSEPLALLSKESNLAQDSDTFAGLSSSGDTATQSDPPTHIKDSILDRSPDTVSALPAKDESQQNRDKVT